MITLRKEESQKVKVARVGKVAVKRRSQKTAAVVEVRVVEVKAKERVKIKAIAATKVVTPRVRSQIHRKKSML